MEMSLEQALLNCGLKKNDPQIKRSSIIGIFLIYVFEIITLNIRCYSFGVVIQGNTEFIGFIIVACIQLLVNMLGCYLISSENGFSICPSSFVVFIILIIINVVRVALTFGNDLIARLVQLGINMFGYFSFLRFWETYIKGPGEYLEASDVKALFVLHIVFTLSVGLCLIVLVAEGHLSEITTIESQVELFLLGYLFAQIDFK